MKTKCPICGKEYTVLEDEAYYLTDEITICDFCGDKIEKFLTNERHDVKNEAQQYLEKYAKEVADIHIKNSLNEILEQVEESREEIEDSFADDEFTYSVASGKELPYVVMQVTLREKFWGTGSRNLTDLEKVINHYAQKGYRLHTMSTVNSDSKGLMMGDRIQATLVFEKKDFFTTK